MKRRAPLKAAFVATIAAASVGGCDGGGGYIATNPPQCVDEEDCQPPALCPQSEPSSGQPCFNPELSCSYGDGCGDAYATCQDGRWSVSHSTCNPPPAWCPDERPELGSACEYQPDSMDGYPYYCHYPVEGPCDASVVLGCQHQDDGSVIWGVVEEAPSCEVLPEQCHLYAEESQCGADAGCRWLVTGCFDPGGEQPIETGCYPAGDCASASCDGWGTCFTGVHDPCHGADCDACGAEISVCMP